MNIEIIDESGDSLSFILTDSTPSFANALRRTVLADVPTLAVEDMEFLENTSSLYDEFLAHRIGLVPIKTDLGIFNFPDECSCEGGCPSCELELTLKKQGPGPVYSDDMLSSNKVLTPRSGIILVKLGRDQAVEFTAKAVLGTGKDHARWQPAVIGYKYYPHIEIGSACDDCGACAQACPRNVFTVEGEKLKVADEKACILCRACVEACNPGAITVEGDKNRFIYEIEGTGSLGPREILKKACDILIDKTDELASKI